MQRCAPNFPIGKVAMEITRYEGCRNHDYWWFHEGAAHRALNWRHIDLLEGWAGDDSRSPHGAGWQDPLIRSSLSQVLECIAVLRGRRLCHRQYVGVPQVPPREWVVGNCFLAESLLVLGAVMAMTLQFPSEMIMFEIRIMGSTLCVKHCKTIYGHPQLAWNGHHGLQS